MLNEVPELVITFLVGEFAWQPLAFSRNQFSTCDGINDAEFHSHRVLFVECDYFTGCALVQKFSESSCLEFPGVFRSECHPLILKPELLLSS